MSDVGFAIVILVAVVLFAGEPDLHDVLLAKVQGECAIEMEGDQ